MAETTLANTRSPFPFAPPPGPVDILIIAGEHSGDQHAAGVVAALRKQRDGLKIAALGGPALEKAGVQLLLDLTKSSVVGLVEVVRHLGFFRQLFHEILRWIEEHRPAMVVFVDYPGLNLRLAKALTDRGLSRKGGGKIILLSYVSPQIWAWKAGRRFKMARWLDGLGVIFPFEVETYADTDLPVEFVGHPLMSPDENLPVSYEANGPLIILPGSRKTPVRRIFPRQLKVLEELRKLRPGLPVVVLYPDDSIRALLESLMQNHAGGMPQQLELKPAGSSVAGSAVLTSSGTMSLICALAGLPGCLVYYAHPATYWIGRRLVKVAYLGMPNLLLKREVYPEFLQQDFVPQKIVPVLLDCLDRPDRLADAKVSQRDLQDLLTAEGNPEDSTAAWVLRYL